MLHSMLLLVKQSMIHKIENTYYSKYIQFFCGKEERILKHNKKKNPIRKWASLGEKYKR